jgi:hypothetical protein
MQSQRLIDYLKADRVWKRPQRIAHARMQLRRAKEAQQDVPHPQNYDEIAFWAQVIHANQWSPFRGKENT